MDADGWLDIVDRKKDLIIASGYKVCRIIASGYKVWPREVEDVLTDHPAVREAAVLTVPDEYRGESVKVFVSLRPRTSAQPRELIDFVGARLAAYKRPREVEIVADLPRTATGKIMRRSLRG